MRRLPVYTPATDAFGLALQLDASVTTTASLTKSGGVAITNGASIEFWKTLIGTARKFGISWAQTVPTWSSSGINGLGSVNFDPAPRVLVADVNTGFASLAGITMMSVFQISSSIGSYITHFAFGCVPAATPQKFGVGNGMTALKTDASARRVSTDASPDALGLTNVSTNVPLVMTTAIDYSNGIINNYTSGVFQSSIAMASSGLSNASDVPCMCVGGMVSTVATGTGNNSNGLLGEVLVWPSLLTADQMILPSTYLKIKWGVQ